MEISVRRPSPPNAYSYVQEEIWIQQEYCFGNQRKFSIFLRNDRVCMVIDPYKARKRYTVTESLDLIVSVK